MVLSWANFLGGFTIFCNFVRNRIYVLAIEVVELVFMARYSKKEAGHNFCDIILPLYNKTTKGITTLSELRYLQDQRFRNHLFI